MRNYQKIVNLMIILFTFSNFSSFAVDYVSFQNGPWSTVTTWTPNGNPGSNDNVTIAHTITLTADAEVNDLTINGGSLSTGNFQLTVNGNFNSIATGLVTTSGSSLVLNGAGNQFIFPTTAAIIKKLTLNRDNGAFSDHDLTFSDAVPVDGIVLVFTIGVLTMGPPARVILHSGAIQKTFTATDASYVDGWVSRFVKKVADWYEFPVGSGGHYRKMSLWCNVGSAANDNEYKIRFYYVAHFRYKFYDAGQLAGGVTDKYYWDLIQISGANVQKRLYFEPTDFPAGYDLNNVVPANYDDGAAQWDVATGGCCSRDAGAQYVATTNENASNGDGWTFASTSAGTPMPVELMSFAGKFDNGKVTLNWSTASEKNNKGFQIQISSDAKKFTDLGFVKGNNTSNKINSYSYVDLSKKEASQYYYRLKQVDNDNSFKLSNMISIACLVDVGQMTVSKPYPNPSNSEGTKINISLPSDGKVNITIFNMMGQEVKRIEKVMKAGEETLDIETHDLAVGTYAYSISFNLQSISGKFTRLSAPVKDKKTESITDTTLIMKKKNK